MSYSVKPGSILGRIGSEIGKGLADQIPKEVERNRLAKGLEDLSQQQGLTPFQQLGRLATLPGVTPQLIQSGAELLKNQGMSSSLVNKANEGQNVKIPKSFQPKPQDKGQASQNPSITTTEGTQATIKGYTPATPEQLRIRAGEILRDDPESVGGDPNKALAQAQMEDQQNQSINTAKQNQRRGQLEVLNNLRNELAGYKEILGASVPGNVFTDLQDKAIEAVNTGQKTEKQAAEDVAKELDSISRDYEAINTIGDWSILTRSPSGNKDALRSIREKFKARDDLENFGDMLISKNGLSPSKAYYMAFPVSEQKELNNAIAKLPRINEITTKRGFPEKFNPQNATEKTNEIAPKLAELMGREGSPLAIATELQGRGYDPQVWMNYLSNNRKKLNLSERQGRELDKPRDFTNSLNDVWMFVFSGLDKLLEQ